MKRWLVVVLIVALAIPGLAYAADAAAPTIADVYQLLVEMKADLATIKDNTSFAKANQAGTLATAASNDNKVTITITSLMSGPDATVIGVSVTNKSSSPVRMSSIDTTLAAGGTKLQLSPMTGIVDEVLPGTTAKGVLLAGPAPASATDVTLRTGIYDSKTLDDLIEPTIVLKLK